MGIPSSSKDAPHVSCKWCEGQVVLRRQHFRQAREHGWALFLWRKLDATELGYQDKQALESLE